MPNLVIGCAFCDGGRLEDCRWVWLDKIRGNTDAEHMEIIRETIEAFGVERYAESYANTVDLVEWHEPSPYQDELLALLEAKYAPHI